MSLERIIQDAKRIKENPSSALLQIGADDELAPVADFLNELLQENRVLRQNNEASINYIRQKIDQLLLVIGTIPLRPEELDDATLINLDPIGIIAESFTQILEHLRQTNEQLELAMDEIKAIFESVGGGILVLDADKKIVSCNHKLQEMFDVQGNQVCGLSCSEVICLGQKIKPCPFDEMLRTGQAVSMSAIYPRNMLHYNIVSAPVRDRDDKIVRTVMLYTDITELMEAKEAVANEKERLSLTLKSIAEGVVVTNSAGDVTMMNEVAETLTGWSLGEAMGKGVCQVINIQKERKPHSCSDTFSDILSKCSTFKHISQTPLIAKDGEEKIIALSIAPIKSGENSAPAGAILVFRDITQEKNMEMEIMRTKKIESLGVLAGGIAHDFNNLLTSIVGNISLARIMAKDNTKIATLLAETENASFRAKNLTGQLLTFAKGGAPVTTITCSKKLIKESAQFSFSGSKIKCLFNISDNLWPVEVDEGQIGQVIHNLVINADHTMKEGGTVDICAENILIDKNDARSLTPGKYIKIDVIDRGEGIEKQHIDKIFDPYFTTKEKGHGLGLSICYSIIKKHAGLVTVESEKGVGTTFFLYLPAADQQLPELATQSLHPEKGEEIFLGHGRILVMDDEELIRDVSSQTLSYLGYSVELAADGQEAIEMYSLAVNQGKPFDAVIVDLTIPGGMGGKEATEHLLQINPKAKIVVSSGYANDPIMANFREHGFSGVIPKPFSMEKLSDILKTVLSESDA